MKVRPAALSDSSNLLLWRNDAVSVRYSISKKPVSPSEHKTWFENVLSGEKIKIFICEVEGTPVGMYRFTYADDGSCELAWIVAPDHRGRGLGSLIVKTATENCPAKRVFARIQIDNTASLSAAKSAGLVAVSQDQDIQLFERP